MLSVPAKRVDEFCQSIDKALTAKDFKSTSVRILHEDGSVHWFQDAFSRLHFSDGRPWLLVFTEHDGYHFYPVDDLYDYGEYEQTKIVKDETFHKKLYDYTLAELKQIHPELERLSINNEGEARMHFSQGRDMTTSEFLRDTPTRDLLERYEQFQ